MLEFLTRANDGDAIAILKQDHEKVKELFDRFENTDDLRQKKKIAAEAIMELKIHATIEEEIFYPALRKRGVEKDILNEADEEHHVAKLLIAELDQMTGSEDHYEAKFIVLAENVRHHIKEEEGEMFPQARRSEADFVALGKELLLRKQQLKKNGVPPSDEDKLIARGGIADSPARNARKASAKKVTAKAKAPARAKARPAPKSPAKKARASGRR